MAYKYPRKLTRPQALLANGLIIVFAFLFIVCAITAAVRGGKISRLEAAASKAAEESSKKEETHTDIAYETDAYGEIIYDEAGHPIPVSTTQPGIDKTTEQYKIIADIGLNLRSMPTTESERLVTIPYGTIVTVTSKNPSGEWGSVVYNGTGGWIRLAPDLAVLQDNVALTTAAATTAEG